MLHNGPDRYVARYKEFLLKSRESTPDRGLACAKQAEKLSPIDFRVLDVTATLLARMGRFDEALRVQRQSIAFLPEAVHAPEILEHLRTYEVRAGAPD